MKCLKCIRKGAFNNKSMPCFACIGLPPWNNSINYKETQTNYDDTVDVANRIIKMNSKEDKWHIVCSNHISVL